jgi:beta-lactam-binding protein with PASTA domain
VARARLKALGFTVAEDTQPDDVITPNRVIETSPSAGTRDVQKGTQVRIVLSSGRQRIEMPTVTGLSTAEARSILTGAKLDVQTREQESDQDPGVVLAQSVAGGTQVAEGSTITITVAKAPAKVDVPDVVGATENVATTRLTTAGFSPTTADAATTDQAQDGRVLKQSPSGKAKKGATVTITVGRYAPATTPTPPPDGTAPGTPTTPAPPPV